MTSNAPVVLRICSQSLPLWSMGFWSTTKNSRCGKVLQLLGGSWSSQLHPWKLTWLPGASPCSKEIHLQMVPFSIDPPSKGLQHDTGGVLAHNWQWETASQILETFHLLVNITSREAKMGWAIHVKSRLVSLIVQHVNIVGWEFDPSIRGQNWAKILGENGYVNMGIPWTGLHGKGAENL